MDERQRRELFETALEIRKDIVRMISLAKTGDVGASLATADLFTYLFWRDLNIRAENPDAGDRDRFLLGDCALLPALYATLSRRGFLSREDLWNFGRLGAVLQTLPGRTRAAGIDAPAVPSGQMLGFALGVCEALRRKNVPGRVRCCVDASDLEQGIFWESARLASEQGADLLLLVLGGGGEGRSISLWGDMAKTQEAFALLGWRTGIVSGHNFDAIEASFAALVGKGPEVLLIEIETGRGLGSVEVDNTRPRLDAALRELDTMRREWER